MANREVELLAVGAGPSNLALAVALEELAPGLARNSLLIERDREVTWQRGMMVPGATSQVSFIKDLVTLRNPRSRFSFLNYLHDKGRLEQFVNMGSTVPYRAELASYHKWSAESLALVGLELARECVEIAPRRSGGTITGFRALMSDGESVESRYLTIAVGRDARVPEQLRGLAAERLIHSTQYVQRIAELPKGKAHRVVVVGSGQSAAELFLAVQADLPRCTATMVMRSIGLAGVEHSKFINELFYSRAVDEFHAADPDARRRILREMHHTNYSGLSPSTITTLYEQIYLDQLNGDGRLEVISMHDITAAREQDGEAVLELTDWRTGLVRELRADVVLLGTGFQPEMPRLVRSLAEAVGQREITVTRDYRMVLDQPSTAACYLLGVNEATHGIADSLLSVLAFRAHDVVQDILSHRAAHLVDDLAAPRIPAPAATAG